MIAANPLPEQLQAVWYAAITGAGLGALYDLFRMIRWWSKSRLMELLLDLLFSVVSAVALFVLVTAVTQLRVRGFLLLGFVLGWFLWSRLAGRPFRWLLQKTGGMLCAAGSVFQHLCFLPVQLYRKHANFLEKITKK
ncbi:MAG: spore cortex biosynthesis protein YabQ [Eubacteriales bacterium]|nr:spore cortex biosynthesis protein YabQ [Eubacteriales bacterium]